MFRKGKFATLVEILPDLILKALYKANKNKKVKVKSPDAAGNDETTQTLNMHNSKCETVPCMILLEVLDLSKIYIFCKKAYAADGREFWVMHFLLYFLIVQELYAASRVAPVWYSSFMVYGTI